LSTSFEAIRKWEKKPNSILEWLSTSHYALLDFDLKPELSNPRLCPQLRNTTDTDLLGESEEAREIDCTR